NSRNWELVYQAIWSLGRLRATEARESLEQIRDTHWSHLVAMEAQKSLDVLDQPLPDFTHVDSGSSAERFIRLEQVMHREPTCQNEVEWQNERLKLETNSVLPLSAKPEQLPEFIPQNAGKENRAVMKVKDGWLVGVSHGEFCGDVAEGYLDCGLHYFSSNGTHTLVVQGNIDGIYQTANNGLVVTEGVDHLMYWPGHVFKLTQANPSSWGVELLAVTQASPRKVAMAADGTLILQTQGSVVAVIQGGN
ncbi:MAG: hypothetical protein ACXWAB_12000, partial [Methylobacter sp.]